MASKKQLKTKTDWNIFFLLLVSVLILGSLIIIWSIQRPFCANSVSCKDSFSLKIENGAYGIFDGNKVYGPAVSLAGEDKGIKVLGEATTNSEKHIFVDLTNQTLSAYDGDTLFMQTFVSTGKWHPTPTGEFTIWEKLRATRMTGGTGADYYDLPNVPYVMFFSGPNAPASSGFGLHGAYWHDNFGHPMSHGCVNMRTVDAQRLYDWVGDSGAKITIFGQAK